MNIYFFISFLEKQAQRYVNICDEIPRKDEHVNLYAHALLLCAYVREKTMDLMFMFSQGNHSSVITFIPHVAIVSL
jgi:hypothetical protein